MEKQQLRPCSFLLLQPAACGLWFRSYRKRAQIHSIGLPVRDGTLLNPCWIPWHPWCVARQLFAIGAGLDYSTDHLPSYSGNRPHWTPHSSPQAKTEAGHNLPWSLLMQDVQWSHMSCIHWWLLPARFLSPHKVYSGIMHIVCIFIHVYSLDAASSKWRHSFRFRRLLSH